MEFKDFGLSSEILKAIEKIGYREATLVQEKTIPEIMTGRDVIMIEATGKGKTAAFGIPLCESVIWEQNLPQALILAPTRELAVQVGREVSDIGRYKKVSVQVIYGKQSYENERLLLKQKCPVVVATAGRLFDHISRGTIDLSRVSFFVMDEFDELIKPGFIEKIDSIIDSLPEDRQNIFVSATLPHDLKKVVEKHMDNPFVYNYFEEGECFQNGSVENQEPDIEQFVLHVSDFDDLSGMSDFEKRMTIIMNILANENSCKSVVFCNTQSMTDRIYEYLKKNIQTAYRIHGDMPQKERENAVKEFKSRLRAVLVSTNLTARGIDIEDIDTVINYEAPFESDKYVHRIGRTGRAGKSGKAFTLVSSSNADMLNKTESAMKSRKTEAYELEIKLETTLYFKSFNTMKSNMSDKERKQEDVTKLYFRGGKNKKFRTTDFVGLLCSIDGITFEDIGVIKVGKEYTIIDILNNKSTKILSEVSNYKIKGKKIFARVAKNQE